MPHMTIEAMSDSGQARRDVVRVEGEAVTAVSDRLAEEVPVALHFDGEPFAVMMASPTDLADFARGFALTEAGIAPADILDIKIRTLIEGIQLDVRTRGAHARSQPRTLPGRSGCGVCGLRDLEDVIRTLESVSTGRRITRVALEAAIASLPSTQRLNAGTGALHAAAWAHGNGDIVLVREDVGRHNAFDKLIGAMDRQGVDIDDGFALVTSRASYEMITKAARARLPMLVAISAPTALAVDLARSCDMTLAGFVRPGRHVIYSHPWRLGEALP